MRIFLTQNNSQGMNQIVLFLLQWTVSWSVWLEQELTDGADWAGEWCLLSVKSGGVLTLSMNGQSVFIAAGFLPSWKFMTLLLRWHSFVAEVVQLQACFGENDDNIHSNLGCFCCSFFFFIFLDSIHEKSM